MNQNIRELFWQSAHKQFVLVLTDNGIITRYTTGKRSNKIISKQILKGLNGAIDFAINDFGSICCVLANGTIRSWSEQSGLYREVSVGFPQNIVGIRPHPCPLGRFAAFTDNGSFGIAPSEGLVWNSEIRETKVIDYIGVDYTLNYRSLTLEAFITDDGHVIFYGDLAPWGFDNIKQVAIWEGDRVMCLDYDGKLCFSGRVRDLLTYGSKVEQHDSVAQALPFISVIHPTKPVLLDEDGYVWIRYGNQFIKIDSPTPVAMIADQTIKFTPRSVKSARTC